MPSHCSRHSEDLTGLEILHRLRINSLRQFECLVRMGSRSTKRQSQSIFTFVLCANAPRFAVTKRAFHLHLQQSCAHHTFFTIFLMRRLAVSTIVLMRSCDHPLSEFPVTNRYHDSDIFKSPHKNCANKCCRENKQSLTATSRT
jgi:hypothetical protein